MDINTNTNATDNLLESMLMEYANAKELVSEGVKEVIKATAINESLKESLMEDDDMASDEDVEDATAVSDETPDVDEVDADDEGENVSDVDIDAGEGDNDSDGLPVADVDTDDTVDGDAAPEPYNPLSEFEPDENGDYDLTGVTDIQKIMDIAKNAPDGTEFVMVKKSAFDVSVNDSEEEPDAAGLPAGDEEEGSDVPMDTDADVDTEVDSDVDAEPVSDYESDESEEDEDEKNPFGMGESVKPKKDKKPVNESDHAKVLKIKNQKIQVYEQKIRQLQAALKESVESKKIVQSNLAKVTSALNEGKNVIQGLSLINKNMVNIAKLFMENATTKNEKKEILEAFDNKVKTIRESDLLFEFYSKNLSTRKTNEDAPNKNTLVESAQPKLKKPISKVNESASFKKETKSDFVRFSEYEI